MPTDPKSDKPNPDSQDGTALPRVDLPSEGDVDLAAFETRAGDLIVAFPDPPKPPVPPPLPDSQAGGALPRVDVPSEGDIDLTAFETRAGDPIPMAELARSAEPPPLPGSHPGTSLPTLDMPSEGDIDLGALQSRSGEEIPLAELPESPSGQSLTSWTEVIRRQRAAAQAGQASVGDLKVDAPSDQDIRIRFDEGAGPPKRTGDTSEILPGELPVFTGPSGRSESDIDLGRAGGTGESEVKFDILYPPSDAGGAMPPPGPLSGSAIDFRSATPVASPSDSVIPFGSIVPPGPSASGSALDLGTGAGPAGEGGRSSILDALLPDVDPRKGGSGSVLDFGEPPLPVRSNKPTLPTAGAEGPAVPTRPGIDLGSRGSVPEVSGRDLVDSDPGLGSEEAIDLYAEPAAAPSITDSGSLEISEAAIEESQRRAELQESSSIDLSSRPSYHGPDLEEALGAQSGTPPKSDSDIDLNLPAVADAGDSSMVHRGEVEVDKDALAAEFKARRQAREAEAARKPARPRREPERAGPGGRGRGFLIGASTLGLLLGAGGVLAAYFAGVLPDRHPAAKTTGGDNSAELAKLKQDADAARKEAAAARADVARQAADARKGAEDEARQLAEGKAASDAQVRKLTGDVQKAQADLTAASKAAADAKTAEQAARINLAAATKTAEDARKDLAGTVAARKAAEDAAVGLTKAVKDAGLDPARPDEGLKGLVAARTAAEAKAKDADARVKAAEAKATETAKRVTDLTAQAESAKKAADDARAAAEAAAKARDASDATVKAVADRLAKARFVGDKADGAAILKGIDDALKAGSGDATKALRDELAKVRADEEKARTELSAAREKEAAAAKAATEAKAEAQKATADLARQTAETTKLKQDASQAVAKATAAEKVAAEERAAAEKAQAEARAATERASTDLVRLKAENDRLTRDLEAVKELAELIKTPAGAVTGPAAKVDPERLGEQFYGDGLRAFHRGQNTEAESAFRKAIQFRPNDARYHYLLGLTLWSRKETAGAEAEFEKGRDLELAGRPTSRAVSAPRWSVFRGRPGRP